LVGIDIDENSIVEDSSAEESQDNGAQLDLNEFLKELGASAEEASNDEEEEGTHLDEMIKKFVEHQGSDKILEVLEEYYAQKGDIVVVEIDADDLINSLSTTDDFVDFVVISGIIKLKANTVWADLAKLIGESEVDWVKTLVQMENPDTMVLFYCEGNYVYAFSNMNANETVNGEETSEDEAEELQPGLDLASFLKSMEHEENADESEEDPEEVMRESAAYLQSDADDSDEEEEDELGYPMIFWSGENINQEQLENYAYKWQTKSSAYAWVGGISGFIPDWFEVFISDAVCPAFSPQELLEIANRVANEKIIPVLNYAPEDLFNHVKRVWWIVPFCIWKEDIASFVFIDKNGFYSMFKNKEGEVVISDIFPWDRVSELEFETEYAADSNVNRLTLHQENGGFLTFDEFVGVGDDGELKGSYLAVVESIWLARKDTIEASKGVPMWYEGKGGEGFVEFDTPQDLLKATNWDNPHRPNSSMFGG
jgi:glutamate synthase domain-containing protein 3